MKNNNMEEIHQSVVGQMLPNTIEDLPDEVLEFILSFLPPYKDLENCMSVCKRWYNCAQNVLHKTSNKLVKAIGEFNILWKNITTTDMLPTITKRFSHAACVHENDMFIFGGCTTNATSFNDLWRFDLSKRQWIRPLATGTYPVPKAYTSMVHYKDCLIVFGGWTYPSLSQYYQNVTMFNEIHFYGVKSNRWILASATNAPPPMAGHSAVVVGDEMIVFGGLVMCSEQSYQIQCSNDVWVLDITHLNWRKQPTTKPQPSPRYAQSLMILDSERLMLLGGVQTLHSRFVYNDCWILSLKGPTWTWKEIAVKNKEWASPNVWCNPACKVGDKVVSLSRSRNGWHTSKPLVTTAVRITSITRAQPSPVSVRVEQSLQRPIDRDHNINGRRGVLPRQQIPSAARAEQIFCMNTLPGPSNGPQIYIPARESDDLNINDPAPGPSSANNKQPECGSDLGKRELAARRVNTKNKGLKIVRQLQEANKYRMAAFACDSSSSQTPPENDLVNQRHIGHLENREPEPEPEPYIDLRPPRPPSLKKVKKNTLTMHVLDISTVVNGNSLNYVTWLCPGMGETEGAPEEVVMYSLVKGNGELIMFGGVHNDITSVSYADQHDMYSNSLHFITIPRDVI